VLLPDLHLSKAHIGVFRTGGLGRYLLTVENLGAGPTIAPISITDPLPAGLTFRSANGPGWDCTASTAHDVACVNLGPLAPYAPALILTFAVTIGPDTPDPIVNTATVSTFCDPDTANDSATDRTKAVPLPVPVMSTAVLSVLIAALFSVAVFGMRRGKAGNGAHFWFTTGLRSRGTPG
jgi:uncharacterized repeat protein (TIGR01451 family)